MTTTAESLNALRLARLQVMATQLVLLEKAVREALDAITAVPSPIMMNSATLKDFLAQVDRAEHEAHRLITLRDEKQRRYDALLVPTKEEP